jgi:hypothetical protein
MLHRVSQVRGNTEWGVQPVCTSRQTQKNPHSAWAKAGWLSLAVFLKRPQADIKSAQRLKDR